MIDQQQPNRANPAYMAAENEQFLAYWFARYQREQGLSEEQLRVILHMSSEQYIQVCLCEIPRQAHLGEDIVEIASHCGSSGWWEPIALELVLRSFPEFRPQQRVHFLSEEHETRFTNGVPDHAIQADGTIDVQYALAIYILTADEYIWALACPYVERGIDFATIIKKLRVGTAQASLIRLAGNLFSHGSVTVNPANWQTLSHQDYQLVMSALEMHRRRRFPYQIVKKEETPSE